MLPLLELDNVSVVRGGRPILQGCSLRIEQGAHIVVSGANGSGKTTLLRVISGLTWPDPARGSRSYSFDGVTRTASPLSVRPAIRYLGPETQERFLRLGPELSLIDFVASGVTDRDYPATELTPAQMSRCRHLLRVFDLESRADLPARKLSHGTLRRAFVARALAGEPRLLVLDEVTDGLDPAATIGVEAALRDAAAAGCTLVMVAHRASALQALTQAHYRLSEGKLVMEPLLHDATAPTAAPASAPVVAPATHEPDADILVDLRDVDVMLSDRRILHRISWTLRRGEHWAIQGENGAGKTTLAGLIEGSVAASVGRIMRLEPRRLSIWELRRRIVLLSDALQIRYDWALSVRDVVASGFSLTIGPPPDLAPGDDLRVRELLERFRLQSLAECELPTLSFGQRRRALLARALVHEPEILILDEIFDGLDSETRGLLHAELLRLAAGGTSLVVIAHRASEIPPFIDRRLTLVAGSIVETHAC